MSAGHNEGEVAPTFPAQPERGERHEFVACSASWLPTGGTLRWHLARNPKWSLVCAGPEGCHCEMGEFCGRLASDPIHHPAPQNDELPLPPICLVTVGYPVKHGIVGRHCGNYLPCPDHEEER